MRCRSHGPVITFRTGSATRVYGTQLLGTASTKTWMQGWVNPSVSEVSKGLAQELAVHGRLESVREFASEHLTLADWSETDPVRRRLAIAAGALKPEWRTYYSGPVGVAMAVMMLRHPELELPAPALPRTMRVLAEGVSHTKLHRMTDAVEKYAIGRGIPVEMSPSRAELTLPGGVTIVEFDPATSRIVGVRGEAGGNSVDAPIAQAVGESAGKKWLPRFLRRGAGR